MSGKSAPRTVRRMVALLVSLLLLVTGASVPASASPIQGLGYVPEAVLATAMDCQADGKDCGYDGHTLTYDAPLDVRPGVAVDSAGFAAPVDQLGNAVPPAARTSDHIYDSSSNFVAPTSAAGDLARVCRSFSADTAVLMADGTAKPISEIEVGDAVRAPDPETGEAGSRTVAGVWPHQDMLLDFNVEGGSVTTTEDHHFWNATDNEWQETQRIDPGDHLLTVDGQLLEAGHLDWTTVHYADAYDLTIDGIHTYYVEAGGPSVLVHNCNFSDHFLRQAVRRGVSREVAEDVVRQPVGSYWHDDLWKQGFYAPVRRTFVGQGPDGGFTTVITDASSVYVDRLLRERP